MEYLVIKHIRNLKTYCTVLIVVLASVFLSFKPKAFSTQNFYSNDSIKIDSISYSNDTIFKVLNNNSIASYYAKKFIGKRTASGAKYDANALTCAHKKLQFGTKLKVTNLKNNKSVVVTVNDRGPFVKNREIDLSEKAFVILAKSKNYGLIKVKVEQIIELSKIERDTIINIKELLIE